MSKPTILVVDDNATNLKLVALLVQANGYEVVTAIDADTALAAVRDTPPRLILMDVHLPGVDGLELTRRLKADPSTAHIPIVAVTACVSEHDHAKALAAGCDDFLAKPIDTRALPQTITRLLG